MKNNDTKLRLTAKFWFLVAVVTLTAASFITANVLGFIVGVAVGVGALLSPAHWFDS